MHRLSITDHHAYILAAKLRRRGIYTAGRDVLHWSRPTVWRAMIWVEGLNSRARRSTWSEYMGENCPPPSQHSWPDSSAAAVTNLDAAGRVGRGGSQ